MVRRLGVSFVSNNTREGHATYSALISIGELFTPRYIPQASDFTPAQKRPQAGRCIVNALPTTGELFATNQVSPETERGYRYQLRNFAQWMSDSRDVHDMEDVTTADLLAYRQSLQHLAGSSQKRYLAAIKSFFEWALESGDNRQEPRSIAEAT